MYKYDSWKLKLEGLSCKSMRSSIGLFTGNQLRVISCVRAVNLCTAGAEQDWSSRADVGIRQDSWTPRTLSNGQEIWAEDMRSCGNKVTGWKW